MSIQSSHPFRTLRFSVDAEERRVVQRALQASKIIHGVGTYNTALLKMCEDYLDMVKATQNIFPQDSRGAVEPEEYPEDSSDYGS
jgi:hypothetical protein